MMASKDVVEVKSSEYATESPPSAKDILDADALKLAEMGYVQEMKRGFSVLSILAVGFSLTNSWFGVSAAMVTGINSGGPVLLIYGIIMIALISIGVGVSLSELASAMPNAGGQYYWAHELAPRRFARLASYTTGWCAYAGSIFTSASVSCSMAAAIVGMYQLGHPDFVIAPWHVVLTYQLFNIAAWFLNTYARILPMISRLSFYCSLLSFLIIIIAVPASASEHNNARYIFTTFINNSGWEQGGIAFILGLINTNWPFACLDCATHLAEEVGQPERAIPIAILGTVAIGFCTSWPFVIAMVASIQNLEEVTLTATYVPILEIFNQAINYAGAIGLETLVVLTGFGCQIACHTWQARLCWSFARDRGLPGWQALRKVDKRMDTPFIAHTVSCVIDGLVGLLYLGSYAAFNSMVTATITLLYLSYAVPVICLLIKGRNNIQHGPFWLGKFGLVCNIVLLSWTLFTFVMYSFPIYMPVTATNMNYISAVYGVIAVIMLIDWFARARKQYTGHSEEAVTEVEKQAAMIAAARRTSAH